MTVIHLGPGPTGLFRRKEIAMATTQVPVRVPERQPSQGENSNTRPASWPREKKATRFVIKLGGVIPF